MSMLPYVTKYLCESSKCIHCNGSFRDKDYLIYVSTHRKHLPHHIYSFMMTITDQIDVWEPSHETLVNIAIPCLTCTENYLERIAEFLKCPLDIVRDRYENDSTTYTTMCSEYLTHLRKTELLSILSDLAQTEREINNQSSTYDYQLLQYGIITLNNWNLLCSSDKELIMMSYGIQQMDVGQAILHIMIQHMENLNIIRQTHPKIFTNKIIRSLWTQCNKNSVIDPDENDTIIKKPIPARPIKIKVNQFAEQVFQMDEELVAGQHAQMSKPLPSPEVTEHSQRKCMDHFVPPHLLTDRTGFTPPPKPNFMDRFSI